MKGKGVSFALRIITVDYYLSSPIPELDVPISEFRGSDVKQVPILRIFGSTSNGKKSCMHVHGVFPYLYIPCEDVTPEPKQTYQIANSIDKAINISLKQSNSSNQHVYKVILVKGIPFYGFHSKHHQFYKIFFYNPSFIKRTADLLQSGAIMGLSYQPHEAHINYIMQFFIDFNLYGMSFINLEYVKFRRKSNNLIDTSSHNTTIDQSYLPDSVQCMSTCECEVDCLAMHILNRQEILNGNLGVNPGLEALWEDERKRHENLNMSHEIMPTPSQIRENVNPTESHKYFDKKLKVKLIINSEMNERLKSDVTSSYLENVGILNSSHKDSLNTSVYPAETPEEENVLNATSMILHHPSLHKSKENKMYNSESFVDEEIVIQHSQFSDTEIHLDSEDFEFMTLLKGMDDENIEEDSILCTQTTAMEGDDQQDVDNFSEIINDDILSSKPQSCNIEDIEDITETSSQPLSWQDSFWEKVDNISQLDGTWDEEDEDFRPRRSLRLGLSKPQKRKKISNDNQEKLELKKRQKKPFNLEEQFKVFEVTPIKSPKKSPIKTPRNFEPLNITIQKSPSLTQHSKSTTNDSLTCTTPTKRKLSLKSKLKVRRIIKSQEYYKTNSIEDCSTDKSSHDIKNELKHHSNTNENNKYSDTCNTNVVLKEAITNRNTSNHDDLSKNEYDNLLSIDDKIKSSKTLTASQYDRQNNYVPQPGTSKISKNIDEDINLSVSTLDESINQNIISFYDTSIYNDTNVFNNVNKEEISPTPIKLKNVASTNLRSSIITKNKNYNSDLKLWLNDSTSDHLENKIKINNFEMDCNSDCSPQNGFKKLIFIPKISPPSYTDISSTMEDYSISKQCNPIPFYSNFKDVGAQIEVGRIILKIKSKQLNDLKEFNSNLIENCGLVSQREKIFIQSNLSQPNLDVHNLDTILTTNRSCILMPVVAPPSFNSVKNWMNSRKLKKNNQLLENKFVHEKIQLFIPTSPGQDFDNSQMEILSVSSCSQISSGTPETPIEYLNKSIQPSISGKTNEQHAVNLSKPCIVSNKLSQKSDNSDDIACGQIHKDDLSFTVENITVENQNKGTLFESETKVMDSYQTITDITSEALMSTSNAFKFSGDNYQDAEVYHENDYLTLLSLEVLASTRGDYNPDPQIDRLCAVFYSVLNDCPTNYKLPQMETGFIIVEDDLLNTDHPNLCRYLNGFASKFNMIVVKTEKDLFDSVLNIISKWDPDILCGYEVEMLSWGYLFQRAFVLDMNLPNKISRVSLENKFNFKKDSQEMNKEIRLIGRITIDIWRLLRHEIALTNYTFENVAYHVLHERLPMFSFKTLTFWWNHPSKLLKSLCVEYYLTRVTGTIRMLQQLDLIGRTSELARLFGIQWYEVLSRGSQFRVESMMIRLSRTFNYVLVSPSVQQRAAMKAPECLPLILEPESRFYSDPVIVLDFQSLYPSMMIAYNYCYSTCIGKAENIGKNAPFQFGASCLRISPKMLKRLSEQDLINWSPCGVGFVKSSVRKGILPDMLQNILNTRFMVKKAMKKYKNDKTLQKILHNRQLGLKLIANVTYGYTAANFSGRMPCVEVGDSVVAKGRETLERAIKVVENTPKWNAKVVYGDTDSIFVLVPGRNYSDAFDIGAEIAQVITDDNPTPVKLKLEKVYQPCILQTKKRYVGYKYESKDQKSPEYEAKGIETVRRDGCPAASKILEKTLKILFETYDVSKVKSYIFRKFQNIIEGKCNIQDFIFAKEFRGMNAYKPGASVPALEIAKRYKAMDHRKEPREGERVPYVIVNGAPGEALLHCARCPSDLILDPSLKINHTYYITRAIIPPLNRCLTLIGADVNLWFAEMPRKQLQPYPTLNVCGKLNDNKKNTISQYFAKINCAGCDEETTEGLCTKCIVKPQETMVVLHNKINKWERNYLLTKKICQSCCGRATEIDCVTINCPILFRFNAYKQDLQQIPFMQQMKTKLLSF
ncbi:DNA polymerase zeta catalytic subunit [Arctopsyche grandis]|uniref:DNA polymerase zeta catalytic subunit n=1 Tax=Arctopsyche grandis TaxID=121162 RepID=UPI00406D7716